MESNSADLDVDPKRMVGTRVLEDVEERSVFTEKNHVCRARAY